MGSSIFAWKKTAAACLSATMALGLVPAGASGSQTEVQVQPWVDFHFNEDAVDNMFTSGDVVAEVTGSVSLQERDAANGKALYLDGSASYLSLRKSDGGSLLTGMDEFTVSFEVKPDRTGTNWGFYAAPNDNAQEANKEHYIGALINGGNTTIERYHNNGSRPSSASASTGADWSHVDVIFTQGATELYVDGIQKSSVESSYVISDILGTDSIFQIGKANWGGGEYYKGWIDNFKIFDKALSKEEIQTVPEEGYRAEVFERLAAGIEAKLSSVTLDNERVSLSDYGGTVTWKSDMDAVSIENGLAAHVAQPPAGANPVTGKLTAVIGVYGLQKEVDVDVTIMPMQDENDLYGYLMVHFIENSAGYAEKIYLDISRGDNPEQWDPLNEGQPILTSHLGTTGVRDPFMTYNPETKTYYILGTDLRVFGGDNADWGPWQRNYSTKMNIWESKDLITWSDLRQVEVTLHKDRGDQKQANLGMMWAPETTWVPDYYGAGEGAFVVYWSSRMYADSDVQQSGSGETKIIWAATKDFTQETWEYGGIFLNTKECIDTTIAQDGDKTYHISKDQTGKGIYMQSTTDKEWWKDGANWTTIQEKIGDARYGAVEGPAVFKDHSNKDRWYLFVDDLPVPGYQPMVSTDLDKGWDYLDSASYYLRPYTKHGGVISLTKAQYNAIREADATSVVTEDLGSVKVEEKTDVSAVVSLLPQAKVTLAYGLGTSKLPVTWDVSSVDTQKTGSYLVTGVVQSIGANKDQWVGKDGSVHYLAEGKTPYSSRALTVTATVVVEEKKAQEPGTEEPGKPNPEEPDNPNPGVPEKVSISKASVKVANAVYTGKAVKPKVTVTYQGKSLKQNADYKVSYGNYKKVGQAKVKLTGIGKFTGSKTVTYPIVPKANKIKQIKPAKGKKLVVKFTKTVGAKGYQVLYSTDKKFKSFQKKNSAKTTVTLTNLKKNKTYYVKVRSYVKIGKKTQYSDYSKTVKKKVTK